MSSFVDARCSLQFSVDWSGGVGQCSILSSKSLGRPSIVRGHAGHLLLDNGNDIDSYNYGSLYYPGVAHCENGNISTSTGPILIIEIAK